MQIDKNTMNDNLKINYKCGKYINLDGFVGIVGFQSPWYLESAVTKKVISSKKFQVVVVTGVCSHSVRKYTTYTSIYLQKSYFTGKQNADSKEDRRSSRFIAITALYLVHLLLML